MTDTKIWKILVVDAKDHHAKYTGYLTSFTPTIDN